MVVAVGIGTAAGLTGAFAHLTAHVLYKGLLFMVAGAIIARTGESSLKRLGGLGRRLPVTFGTFLVAALAITGVPPFSGFVSKGLIAKAVESGGGDLLWWALVLGSVGTALSFAKFGYYAFLRPAPAPITVGPASRVLAPVLVIVALPSVVFGLFPAAFLGLFPGDPGFDAYAASELTKAALTTGAGIAIFALFRGPLGRIRPVDVDRWLHPGAARLAGGAAALAAGTGTAASHAGSRLADRLGAVVGRDTPTTRPELRAALLALVATAGAAVLVATLL
jgi:multicomponent Na+:H+ antiporter subunit D